MKITTIKEHDFESLKHKYFPDKDLYPLHSSLSNEFYTEYFASYNSKFEDISCIIFDENQAYCLIGLTVSIDSDKTVKLGYYGLPSYYQENGGLSFSHKKQAQKLLGKYIKDIIFSFDVKKIHFLDVNFYLSPMALVLLKEDCNASIKLVQNIDLNQPMSDIKKCFRKGHKAAINWAVKNIETKVLSSKNVSWSDMERFRSLHIQVSGRETRSEKTWRIQYDMIKNNEAFAVFGEKNGILVTAALFQYSHKICFYSISASNRELFEKPISHVLIWIAIERARLLNCKTFEVGEQVYDKVNKKKESNISDFKRGFGGDILAQTVISK